MTTSVDSAIATQNAAGEIVSLVLTGASDECLGGALTIQITDLNTGEMLGFGNAPYDGASWTKTLVVPEDISGEVLSCGQVLQVALLCRQGTVSTQLGLLVDTIQIECDPCPILIDRAAGIPSAGSGLNTLTVFGTAAGCTTVHVSAVADNGNVVVADVPITDGNWSAVISGGANGAGTSLKAFDCDGSIDVTVTCGENPECSAAASLTVECGICTFVGSTRISRVSDGIDLNTPNPTCDDSGSGEYAINVMGPSESAVTVVQWTESSSATDGTAVMQDVAGSPIVSNPLTVNIEYPPGIAMSHTYTAQLLDGQGCLGTASATFSCGGGDTNPCVFSDWSRWGPCIDGVQRRTRTVVSPAQNGGPECGPLEETRRCPPIVVDCEVTPWSDWGRCQNRVQRRTRTVITPPQNGGRLCPELEDQRPCPDTICDGCCIWNWINIGLFAVTAIFIVVTICMLSTTFFAVLLTIFTVGLAPVLAALSTANIIMLVISAVLLILAIVSWAVWSWVCLNNNPNACPLLIQLMLALSAMVILSVIIAVALAVFGQFLCAAASAFNVAWLGTILALVTWIAAAFDCFSRPVRSSEE